MSQWVPENYKPCVIMAEGPYATSYWETDIQLTLVLGLNTFLLTST